MKNDNPIYIVRGIPHSGKTPFVAALEDALYKSLHKTISTVDQDSFWWKGDADCSPYEYTGRPFDATMQEIGYAFWHLCEYPESPLIAEGVFLNESDIKPFLDLAERFGRDVVVIRTEMNPKDEDYKKFPRPSNHTLPPPEDIERMRQSVWPIQDEIIVRDETAASIIADLARELAELQAKEQENIELVAAVETAAVGR